MQDVVSHRHWQEEELRHMFVYFDDDYSDSLDMAELHSCFQGKTKTSSWRQFY
jgi:hypothetical protein